MEAERIPLYFTIVLGNRADPEVIYTLCQHIIQIILCASRRFIRIDQILSIAVAETDIIAIDLAFRIPAQGEIALGYHWHILIPAQDVVGPNIRFGNRSIILCLIIIMAIRIVNFIVIIPIVSIGIRVFFGIICIGIFG